MATHGEKLAQLRKQAHAFEQKWTGDSIGDTLASAETALVQAHEYWNKHDYLNAFLRWHFAQALLDLADRTMQGTK